MWIPDFMLKIIGKDLATKLGLQEDSMNGTKSWYTSKTIWANAVSFLIAVYGLVGQYLAPTFSFHLPAVPGMLLTVLSAMGIYGRIDADKTIG